MSALTVDPVGYDDAVAAALAQAMSQEMAQRYGDGGASPAAASDFMAPGTFVVARRDGEPVGCCGLRLLAPGTGEVKRMYTVPQARGRGVGRALLRAVVAHAREQALTRLQLETGTLQPEAIGLYESEGWLPVAPYGHYRHDPRSRCYALDL